ncbi:unnamed protein product [Pedinophyceae sp. YPF-701]|nr:unnamed protein product [Pedinophyceae sp. YPF-701]
MSGTPAAPLEDPATPIEPGPAPRPPAKALESSRRNMAMFFLQGLLNNVSYVIMIAGANSISEASVGLVYFCAIFPCLVVKTTGPYWFHLCTYRARQWACAALMAAAYCCVAYGYGRSQAVQLAGVCISSVQGGLGEASNLAMASFFDSKRMLTLWSSGTGLAGVAGYTWVAVLHTLLGMSFPAVQILAAFTAFVWLANFHVVMQPTHGLLQAEANVRQRSGADGRLVQSAVRAAHGAARPARRHDLAGGVAPVEAEALLSQGGQSDSERHGRPRRLHERLRRGERVVQSDVEARQGPGGVLPGGDAGHGAWKTADMRFGERVRRTLSLWPYTVPLVTVYALEYVLQSGVWTAIGFPVESARARHRFYEFSNWMYQAGVFVSRSSGMAFQASRPVLWAMPVLQACFLAFFTWVAVDHVLYSWWLLAPCFCVGLLGGGVYVNAFTLMSSEVPLQYREFSLGAASLADSLGICIADIFGIFVQGCLFKANNLPGAAFSCGS